MSHSHDSTSGRRGAGSPGRVFAEVLRLAGAGPDDDRWARIATLALGLTLDELAELARALESWPDEPRTAPRTWGVRRWPGASGPYCPPALRIARVLAIVTRPLAADDLRVLVDCGHLDAVRDLFLYDNGLDRAGIEILAEARCFANLANLTILCRNLSDDGARILAGGSAFPAVTSLRLQQNDLSDAAIEGLCAGAGLPRLSALGLDHNRIGPEGARILSSTPRLSGLVRLSLARNPIGAEGALAIASSPHLGALRSLDLHDTGLDDAGSRRLLDSGGLERLEILDLGGNPLDASLLQAALATASGPLPRIVF